MYKRKRAGNTITRKINSTKDTAAKADKNHYISNSYLEGFIPIDTEYFTASLGAEIDFPILLAAGVPYLVDTAPAISPAPSVRRYSDGRVAQLALVKMLVEQVEHFLGFSYDFRYLQHGCGLLKDMFYFCE